MAKNVARDYFRHCRQKVPLEWAGSLADPDPVEGVVADREEQARLREEGPLVTAVPPAAEATPPVEVRSLEINGKMVDLSLSEKWNGLPPTAILSWVREEDNVRYTLTANLEQVTLDELMRIAETIR